MSYWWCPSCKEEVDGRSVTFQEKHENCGYPVKWIEDRMTGLTFSEALERCRAGARIRRNGWNGKNQFVYYQKGSVVAVPDLRCDAIREWAQKDGLMGIEVMGHFDIKTTIGGIQCGWLASQGDMQAEDWEVC
jgi:hypothetical protein